jgi:hypothetical protein
MFKSRLFNVFVAIALVMVVALTIREAAATAGMILETDLTTRAKAVECVNLPSHYSIRTEYLKEADMWVVRWENVAAGVDGGLLELLSNNQSCSSIKEK